MNKEQTTHNSINAVSSWQQTATKCQYHFFTILTIALVVSFTVTILFFYWSKSRNHEMTLENNMKYLQIAGIQEADLVENAFEDGVGLVTNLSRRYTNMLQLLPEKSIEERLELLSDVTQFDRIGHVSRDGWDTTLQGYADVHDRAYFIKGINGEIGYDFLKESRVTGKPCVVFYAPIYQEDQIEGVMIGFFESTRLNSMFSVEMFSYAPDAYLMLIDGTVIANSKHTTENTNMLDVLKDREFIGETTYQDILDAVSDQSRASIMLEFLEDEGETSVGVVTQLKNCEWFILSILPGSVSSEMINNINHTSKTLMFGITTTFILLIAAMSVMIAVNGKQARTEILTTRNQLECALTNEREQSLIVDTLATTYSSVYVIDTTTQTYKRIEEQQISSVNAIASGGRWQDAVDVYTNGHVDEQYNDAVADFLNIEKFGEYLRDRDSVTMEMKRMDGSWRKMYLFATKRDEDGQLLAVTFAVQRIDEEKRKEEMAQKALQEAFNAAQLANNAKTPFLSNMSHDIRTHECNYRHDHDCIQQFGQQRKSFRLLAKN